jgi:hypothetical protein
LLSADNLRKNLLLPTLKEVVYEREGILRFDGFDHDLSSGKMVLNDKSKSSDFSLSIPYTIHQSHYIFKYYFNVEENKTSFSKEFSIFSLDDTLIYSQNRNYIYFDFDVFYRNLILPKIENAEEEFVLKFSGKKRYLNPYQPTEDDYIGLIFFLRNHLIWNTRESNQFPKFWKNFQDDEGVDQLELDELIQGHFSNALRYLIKINTVSNGIDERILENALKGILHFLGIKPLTFYEGIASEYIRLSDRFLQLANCTYIPSIKGQTKRSYHASDDYILNNLLKKYIENSLSSEKEKFVLDWLSDFKLKDFSVQRSDELNQNYLRVNGRLLADLGFGITQLSAILLSTALAEHGQLMLFEEPESNLHPKFQSKLADLFIDAQKQFNHQFIIETHSEYMIRKFQYLVAKGEMKSEDIVIYYLHDPNDEDVKAGRVKQVKKILINSNGSLSDDFGTGFFDEADKIAIDLFLLNKNQNN